MGKRTQIKTNVKQVQDPELVDMFQQMIDPSKSDPDIVYPKPRR